jgi:hypothetical protein
MLLLALRVDVGNRKVTAMGLTPRTNYTVQVRAVHIDHLNSVFFTNGPLATVTAPPGMYLTYINFDEHNVHTLPSLPV